MDKTKPLAFLSSWLKVSSSFNSDTHVSFCLVMNGLFTISSNEEQTDILLQLPTNDIRTTTINADQKCFEIHLEQGYYCFNCDSLKQAKKWVVALTPHQMTRLKAPNILDFSIIKKIGSGYSGEVVLAQHVETGQYFALKSIPKEKLLRSRKTTRAISERNILMQASHPFITRLISTFQTSERLFLVLEFIQGGDLSFNLNRGSILSFDNVRLYLAEITTALSYLHNMGIVFRDLKPSNILIGKDGHLKLTDFGLARYLVDNSMSNSLCGTSEYLAPEMIEDHGYTFAVDWWSFGVLAFQLFEGILPFRSMNLTRLYHQITHTPVKFFKPLQPMVKDFIERLLIKDPKQRLGCGNKGEKEIFDHPFFNGIVWEDVYNKKYDPPFKPFNSNFCDVDENFDKSITSQKPESCRSETDIYETPMHINGFSFTNLEELSNYIAKENNEPNSELIK